MSKTNLGRVSIAPKGVWDASTAYKKLDVVNNNGASWLAMQDNTGVTPADGESWMNLIDITKEGVIDALGYEPESVQKNRTTIFNSTLTEDTTNVTITQDVNGQPFELRSLAIVMQYKGVVEKSAPLADQFFKSGAYIRYEFGLISKTDEYLYFASGFTNLIGKTWVAMFGKMSQGNSIPVYFAPNDANLLLNENGGITKIVIHEWAAGRYMPSGTKITIMGVPW